MIGTLPIGVTPVGVPVESEAAAAAIKHFLAMMGCGT